MHPIRNMLVAAIALAFGAAIARAVPPTAPPDVPLPDATTVRDDVWTPLPGEIPQLELDLEGPDTLFDLLAEFQGTSILFRVRDRASGRPLAVIKTESRSTSVSAEIYAWRLAATLGFPGVVVPTSPVALQGDALRKLRDLLATRVFQDPKKDGARRKVVAEIDAELAAGRALTGAIKPWLQCFMFTQTYGSRENLVEEDVVRWLKADGPRPDGSDVTISQFTELYAPTGLHRGTLSQRRLAADLSDIMLMDALMGQDDRFAGGNLHFWHAGGRRVRDGGADDLPVWNLGRVRLLALDNGAALRNGNDIAFGDLAGEADPRTRVERFDHAVVAKLRELGRRVLATGGGADATPPARIWASLGLYGVRSKRAAANLKRVLDYVDGLEAAYGDAVWLPVSDSVAAGEP